MKKPIKLRRGDKANYETLLRAAENKDLALVSSIRKSDGKNVALLCAVEHNDTNNYLVIPLAVMIEGDPYELFEDPTKG